MSPMESVDARLHLLFADTPKTIGRSGRMMGVDHVTTKSCQALGRSIFAKRSLCLDDLAVRL